MIRKLLLVCIVLAGMGGCVSQRPSVSARKGLTAEQPNDFPTKFGSAFSPAFAAGDTPAFVGEFTGAFSGTNVVVLANLNFQPNAAQTSATAAQLAQAAAAYHLLMELRNPTPNMTNVAADLATLGGAVGSASSPPAPGPFFTTAISYSEATGYTWSGLPFSIVDMTQHPDLGPLVAYLQANQPTEVVVGFGNLNNIDLPAQSLYADCALDVQAVVRLIRIQCPGAFVWITACYAAPTYPAWISQVGTLGDGVALWNVSYFPIVERFPPIRAQVSADAGGRPVMLLGFFGYDLAASRPANYDALMAQAVAAAQAAGFAGITEVNH